MTDTDEFVLAPAPPRPKSHRPAHWSRSAVTWVAASAALVLAGVLASPGPVYPDLGEGIAWNVLELDLRTEPTLTWSSDLPTATTVLGHSGDAVVLNQEHEPQEGEDWPARTLIALDAQTGAQRWQIEDNHRTCQIGRGAVTCVLDPGTERANVEVHPTDGTTGTVIPYPGVLKALALDDGEMLVVEGGSTELAELIRLDSEGDALWSTALNFSGMADASYGDLAAFGNVASVNGGLLFDLASGEELVTTGTVAHDGTERVRRDDLATAVTLPDGDELLVRPGELWLDVDDAFGGPVSLTIDADGAVVVTWDEGRSTRTIPEGTGWPVLRLNGVLVVQLPVLDSGGTQRVVGIDQTTGAQLWERTREPRFTTVPIGFAGRASAIASSDTLVLLTDGHLEGIDPLTGEARWSIPVQGDRARASVLDDGLLVWTSDTVMRLG